MKLVVLLLLLFPVGLRGENPFYASITKNTEEYYSQCLQDKFLNETFFKNKRDGVFVDIGAHNGIAYSNTKFFEELGWSGICIEPIPEAFEELKQNRTALCIQGCISDKVGSAKFLRVKGAPEQLSGLIEKYEESHLQRVFREVAAPDSHGSLDMITVECYLLNDVLAKNNVFHVDFLSIDTEGGELEILKSIDFERFRIDFIDVENNFNSQEIRDFLQSKGFVFVTNTGWNDIFRRL